MKYIFISILIASLLSNQEVTSNDTIHISNDLYLVEINKNAYVHVSFNPDSEYGRFPSNGLVYINDNKAIVFDTPITEKETELLINWMTDSMHFEVIGLVINHWHNDCQEGIEHFQVRNIKTYASDNTIAISKEKALPVPEIGFEDSLRINVGKTHIDCYYYGEAHSSDNIVCYIPSEKILFGGCMVKSARSRGLGSLTDANLEAWPKTIKTVKDRFKTAEIVIPGHGPYGDLSLLEHTLELLEKK